MSAKAPARGRLLGADGAASSPPAPRWKTHSPALPGLGQDLLKKPFSGHVAELGPAAAERASEACSAEPVSAPGAPARPPSLRRQRWLLPKSRKRIARHHARCVPGHTHFAKQTANKCGHSDEGQRRTVGAGSQTKPCPLRECIPRTEEEGESCSQCAAPWPRRVGGPRRSEAAGLLWIPSGRWS